MGESSKTASIPKNEHASLPFKTISLFFGACAIAGIVSTAPILFAAFNPPLTLPQRLTPYALICGATACGSLVGFLFGVPKMKTSERQDLKDGSSWLTPNTNLEQISDWLTKIIVGLGLVNLKQLPEAVETFGTRLASASPTLGNSVFSLGLTFYFGILGFGFSYLSGQLWLPFFYKRVIEATSATLVKAVDNEIDSRKSSDHALLNESEANAHNDPDSQKAKSNSSLPLALLEDGIPADLHALADTYMNVRIRDWRERTAEKDRIAAKLGALVLQENVSRELLANSSNEGLWMALACACLNSPRQGDLDILARIAPRLTRLHVKYRFTLAFMELKRTGLSTPSEISSALQAIENFRNGADTSLLEALDRAKLYLMTNTFG